MNRTYIYLSGLLIVLALIAVGAFVFMHRTPNLAMNVTATASYLCREGKTMDASFTQESVTLTLSDTRALILPQVVSGSGIRYEKEGIAFIGKGNNAFLEENGTQTYADCVATGNNNDANANGGLKQFSDSSGTFSFMYPESMTVSGSDGSYTQSWMQNASSSGLILVKTILSKAFQPQTNFSEATLTVGTSGDPSAVSGCVTFNPTGGLKTAAETRTVNGTTFTILRSSDAGAGNLYETTSYRTLRNDQCYVLEYTIHSTNLGNYSPDQGIQKFDEDAVKNVLESVVQSFQFTDGA